MKTILSFFENLATGRNVLIALAVYLLFPIFILPTATNRLAEAASKEKVDIMDLQFGFTRTHAFEILNNLGDKGRSLYQTLEWTMDVAYPLAYGCFFTLLTLFLFKKLNIRPSLRPLGLLTLVGVCFDFLENMGILNLINSFPNLSDSAVNFASIANILKWITAGAGMLLAIGTLILWVFKRFSGTK